MVYKIVDVDYAFAGGTYSSGDVIASAIEIPQIVRGPNMSGLLVDVTLIDTTDTGIALDLFFFDRFISFGVGDGTPLGILLTITRSAFAGTPTILDADAKAGILFPVPIATTDYKDVGGAKVATVNVGRILQGNDAGTGFVSIMAGGSITTTSGTLRLRLGIDQEK